MYVINIEMIDCKSEDTLSEIYAKHDGQVLCLLNNGNYIAGDLEWDQGYSPNYHIKKGLLRHYYDDIKSIGVLPV